MDPIRLSKFCSSQGICSRREADERIASGRILVDGKRARLGQRVTGNEKIEVDGQSVTRKHVPTQVILFHKPKQVECTLKSMSDAKTLADYRFGPHRYFPIGRLDKDSRGLLLLTNNGDLGNRLAHPRYQQEKEYLVTTQKPLTPEALKALSIGIKIDHKVTIPCEVEQILPEVFRIVLKEGRNRQIRKMCEAIGYKVIDLVRIRIKNIKLGELPENKWRVLSEVEVASLKMRPSESMRERKAPR